MKLNTVITIVQNIKQATHLSPFLATFTSSDVSLLTELELFSLSLPPYPTVYLFAIIVPDHLGLCVCFLLAAGGRLPCAGVWVSFSCSFIIDGQAFLIFLGDTISSNTPDVLKEKKRLKIS